MLAQVAAAAAGAGAGDHAGALGNAHIMAQVQQMAQVLPRMPHMLAADATHKNTKTPDNICSSYSSATAAILAVQQLFCGTYSILHIRSRYTPCNWLLLQARTRRLRYDRQ